MWIKADKVNEVDSGEGDIRRWKTNFLPLGPELVLSGRGERREARGDLYSEKLYRISIRRA